MAKETITRLIDDLDGGEAHETVTFGLDGWSYEIDLSTKNATKLRNALSWPRKRTAGTCVALSLEDRRLKRVLSYHILVRT